MQSLHVFFDISAVAAALGAGAVLVQTTGRLRSAEAKRNALQSRLKELEDERAAGAAKADDATAAVQATTEKLLQAANKRVADLEKAVQSAEKQQAVGAQRVADLEKSLAEQKSIAHQKSVDLEQAKAKAAVVPAAAPAPQPIVLAAPPVEITAEAPPIRVPAVGTKKALMTVLIGASREAKAPGEMEKHLTEANYKVVRATSSENILTTARDTRPDLVVLDTQVSGGDSLTTLESFKADSELREIPIVVVCALKDRDKAVELGAAGCVVPPITSNVLLGTVKTAFIAHRKRMERSRLAKTANTGSGTDRTAVLSSAE